jgi:hypothetical protein
MDFFENQAAFLIDYQKNVKHPKTQKEILDTVMRYLPDHMLEDKAIFIISKVNSKTGGDLAFPFSQVTYMEEGDASVSNRFCYDGVPYEYEGVPEEQI